MKQFYPAILYIFGLSIFFLSDISMPQIMLAVSGEVKHVVIPVLVVLLIAILVSRFVTFELDKKRYSKLKILTAAYSISLVISFSYFMAQLLVANSYLEVSFNTLAVGIGLGTILFLLIPITIITFTCSVMGLFSSRNEENEL
jgi:predicted small secreted protein